MSLPKKRIPNAKVNKNPESQTIGTKIFKGLHIKNNIP